MIAESMMPEERVKRAWGKVTFGPGWERRLSALMADEIREAVTEALVREAAVVTSVPKKETHDY